MKQSFVITVVLCGCTMCAVADTINVNWVVDGANYANTTCETGGDLILPQNTPSKYGHTFVGWRQPIYYKLEYIQSTGSQYIDTIYLPPFMDSTKIVRITTLFETVVPLGNWKFVVTNLLDNDNAYQVVPFGTNDGLTIKVRYGYSRGGDTNIIDTGLKSGKTKIETISQAKTFSVLANDNLIGTSVCTSAPSEQSIIKLLYESTYRLYSFSISVDGVMMENLIPVQRLSDYAVGMYDTVSETFLENAGNGEFITGPIIGYL